jgi:FKBP-type peptidyl-prolyl cis-trans isomerase
MKKITITIILAIILILIITAIYLFSQQNKMTLTASLNQPNQPENQQTSNSYDIQGMKVEVLKEGTGEVAKTGDTVSVHYVGTLENGTKFDSSVDRGEQFSFTLGENRVIQGWELGVLGMKVGEKRKLTIPADLAYGDRAVGNLIPANATLVFEVELFGIN